jgi:anti-sigma regulatory factor (Ser/Thr protein kinase)
MFGFPRLKQEMAAHNDMDTINEYLLERLATFTGPDWEQEDDVMLVSLRGRQPPSDSQADAWQIRTQFTIPSRPGNERQAMDLVAASLNEVALDDERMQKLKTAVAEATMNAMEHGNDYDPEKDVDIEVSTSPTAVRVRITDQGSTGLISHAQAPDLVAKLAGEQSPRGWGLFLIQNMVDEMKTHSDGGQHTIELLMNLDPN